jgi:hypothetical protein
VTRDEYLRVPYVLVVESVDGPDGRGLCRASYPELPGAWAEAASAADAVNLAAERRVTVILDRLSRRRPIPVPRPPVRP